MKKQLTANSIQVKVGANIKTIRILKGKNVKEIAAALNLCPTSYRNLETGETDISISKLEKLTLLFDVNVYQFYEIDYNSTNTKTQVDLKQPDVNKQIKDLNNLEKEEINFLKKRIEFLESLLYNNSSQYPDLVKVNKLYKIDSPNRK